MRLLTAIACVAILTFIPICSNRHAVPRAEEAICREDAAVLRKAIAAYTAARGKAPKAPSDLVDAGYLLSIPENPTAPGEIDPVPHQEGLSRLDGLHPPL
jgi:general secretion pathway protein G